MADDPGSDPQSDSSAKLDNATVEAAADATANAGVPALPFALQNGERVVLFSRRHWVFLWPRLSLHALYGVAAVVGAGWIVNRISGLDGTSGKVFWVIAAIWIVYWAVRCYFDWYSYYHDIWVVTNQRIIDSIKPNFFNSRLASADLVDVEDISVQHSGIFATAFKYGDLRCQTAGEQPNFVLGGVPNPTHILSVVDASRDSARRESGRGWR
jgi:hypothetical protein